MAMFLLPFVSPFHFPSKSSLPISITFLPSSFTHSKAEDRRNRIDMAPLKSVCIPVLGKTVGKKKPKPRKWNPVDLVRQTRSLLIYLHSDHHLSTSASKKHSDKMMELGKLIRELKIVLYGDTEIEPSEEACAQLSREFFREDTLRILILFLPKLNLEARKDATQVVANLQRQPMRSRPHVSDYLAANLDLMDRLLSGYEDSNIALHYGVMLRECSRHQIVANYILNTEHMKKLFDYIQLPNFDIAADATETFKELLTRHKSTVSEFLSENYYWFFPEFNSKLLKSTNYITRRQAIKLLGWILFDRSNFNVMMRYVDSKDNLMILMNLLRESSKSIPIDAFHVFKLFVANESKPPDIVSILVVNRSKLLRLLGGLNIDPENEQFEVDKEQVVKEIIELKPKA